jgi:hypothetical protein
MVSNLKIGVRSEESSFLFCARPRMASNLKIGNWELGRRIFINYRKQTLFISGIWYIGHKSDHKCPLQSVFPGVL